MSERPRIVVALARPDTELKRVARRRYVGALERAGADVVMVSPGQEPPDRFDGLCLTGGEDVDPARYAESDEGSERSDPERDALEFALVESARKRGVPVLGICRGSQLLNVALGGTLVQHLEGHRPSEPEGLIEHEVAPLSGSKLADATTDRPHRVNSRHHQAIREDQLAPGLVPTVVVGGLVEAFETEDGPWLVAVQWHPERTAEVDPEAVGLFGAFVRAAEGVPLR